LQKNELTAYHGIKFEFIPDELSKSIVYPLDFDKIFDRQTPKKANNFNSGRNLMKFTSAKRDQSLLINSAPQNLERRNPRYTPNAYASISIKKKQNLRSPSAMSVVSGRSSSTVAGE
jgi:hypothetical protein